MRRGAPRGARKLARLARTAALDVAAIAGRLSAGREARGGTVDARATISLEAACFTRPPSGVARYVAALARHLPAVLPEHTIELRGAGGTDLRGAARDARAVTAPGTALHHVTWQDFAGHHNWPLGWAPRSVLTVHDLINLEHPDYHPGWERWWYGRTLLAACRDAQRVIVPSRATAAALTRFAGAELPHLRVVPHGVEPGFGDDVPASGDAAALERLGIHGELLLCVSTLYAHKGLTTLLDAYASLRERRAAALLATPPLVLAGEPLWEPTVRAVHARASEPGLTGHVKVVGHVGEDTLVALYRRARVLVFASTAEGFGLPVLEAMALGTPVVCSDAASLPEVAGDAALLVPCGDAEALAAAIGRVLGSARLASSLAERGRERARTLTWSACARATAAVYGELLAEPLPEVA
ncbi:MAG: glycosyltransferase family 4 protein [Deltaproteobacteria bacterium]|nr:glycosyltransferase family 4 protein [Deltaproteobacteria bacterium]